MSLSSAYTELTHLDVKFKDGTFIDICLYIPLELTLDFNNPDFSYDNVIEFDDETKSKLQKEFVRNWEKTNLQNVDWISDEWDD